ncbi:hypothetical protein [Crocosphaera watsonii]|uniref:hypothetical protein n=2 Tax=Crocosphaera watsonii TaxID=263511 RepID=UPI0030DDB15B
MESLDRKFLGEDNSFKGEKDNLPKIAETGMTQRLESGTAQPEEVYIIGSAVPDEIDEIESPISSPIDEREPKELKLPMKRGVDQEEQKKVYRLAPPQYVQTPEGELFQLPMNRGFHDWCSFKYGDLIYNSREIFPGPLWVIGSDHSEGCGLIVADESGIEIIPYRYGVLWPSQRLS